MPLENRRIVDPVLTTVALGYKNSEFVADALFPIVPVSKRGGQIVVFDKDAFRKMLTLRAPGSETKRVIYGRGKDRFSLNQHALDAVVPREWVEESRDVPNVNESTIALNNTMDIILLSHERECADIAQDTANYDSTHQHDAGGSWSTGVGFFEQYNQAREAIRKSIGRYPNTLQIPAKAYAAMTLAVDNGTHEIAKRFKWVSDKSITKEMLARILELDTIVVGKAVGAADDTADAELTDIWTAAQLVYIPPAQLRSMGYPSYGYTYRLLNNPEVEASYYDRSIKSWVHGVTDERAPYSTGKGAGYLFTNLTN